MKTSKVSMEPMLQTIASVPTDTKDGDFESSPSRQQLLFSNHKVYSTLYDVQPELIRLYTGEYKQFTELVCPNCGHLAIEPKDCV